MWSEMRAGVVSKMLSKPADDNDISKLSRRKYQFGFIILVNCLAELCLNIYWHTYFTIFVLSGMMLVIGVLLKLTRITEKDHRGLAIVLLGALLLLLCLAEGSKAGCYLYYIAMLVAIPQVLKNNKAYNRSLAYYLSLTAIYFLLCVFCCNNDGYWQHIPPQVCQFKFCVNGVMTLELILMFIYMTVYYDKQHARALMEQKDKAEDAMAARIKFLSNMGHELRTPLNGIIGASQLLKGEVILPDQEEYLDIVSYCSKHMLELVNNILDFNKIEAGRVELHNEPINIGKLLEKALSPFRNQFNKKGICLISDIDKRLDLDIYADDMRLIQILNNLISNAFKFTDYGHVTLGAQLLEDTDTTIHIKFAVKDTGIGLSPEDCARVFERFWQCYNESTRKYSGTGLGMSICNMLLGMMQSKLELESTKGEGSTFTFSVWFDKVPEQVAVLPVRRSSERSLEGFSVLIAEDNAINMTIATKTLAKWKCKVTGACNGVKALQQLEQCSNYDIILLDLEMPEMDGFTAIKHIKQLYPHIPVLAFSAALMDTEMYNRLIAMGFDDCVLKPFQADKLFDKIYTFAANRHLRRITA